MFAFNVCRDVAPPVESWVVRYRVYLEQDEDGVFVATCPALPGCVSQGRTRAEAAENIREAIEGYLKSLKKHGDPVPPFQTIRNSPREPFGL
jgi:predicted RNase H-like HicB family nuclease